jgi:hypothetical protein
MSLKRVIGNTPDRKTRFHTARGRLYLDGLYTAALKRPKAQSGPWMAPGAVARLEELLTPTTTLLELGSGLSTLWYAARCARVIAVEDDPIWAARIGSYVSAVPNAEVNTSEMAAALQAAGNFDVIVIDHLDRAHNRIDSLKMARDKMPKIIVLDDSDRNLYADANTIMTDWTCERYTGYRPRPLYPTETTIWLRSANCHERSH